MPDFAHRCNSTESGRLKTCTPKWERSRFGSLPIRDDTISPEALRDRNNPKFPFAREQLVLLFKSGKVVRFDKKTEHAIKDDELALLAVDATQRQIPGSNECS